MADEAVTEVEPDVLDEAASSPDPSPESTQPEEQATEIPENQEPVDDQGVPLRNRAAEATRKARQMAKAERDLLTPAPVADDDQNEAIRLVEQIAEQKVMKRLEPVLAKQFLMENPDAAEMIEDINRVRNEYPELRGIDRLDLAYKIAKAERQDEIIRQRVEREARAAEETRTRATQASAEGTGRTSAPPDTLAQRISSAGSVKELKELEALLTR